MSIRDKWILHVVLHHFGFCLKRAGLLCLIVPFDFEHGYVLATETFCALLSFVSDFFLFCALLNRWTLMATDGFCNMLLSIFYYVVIPLAPPGTTSPKDARLRR